jgi:hypothetical protein
MRWLVTLGALALVGCGVRNPQFQDAQAESSSGPGYTSDANTTGGPKPDPTGAPHTSGTGNPTGPIDPPEPVTTSSESGAEETYLGSADATSGIGSSGTWGEPVVLVYSSVALWASDPDPEIEYAEPRADGLCPERRPKECETGSRSLLRTQFRDIFGAFQLLQAGDLDVYALGGIDAMLIAFSYEELLADGPAQPLSGIGLGDDVGTFWTGGDDPEPEHCSNWSGAAATPGRTSSFGATGPGWLHGDLESCATPLPLLCACLTDENPFL